MKNELIFFSSIFYTSKDFVLCIWRERPSIQLSLFHCRKYDHGLAYPLQSDKPCMNSINLVGTYLTWPHEIIFIKRLPYGYDFSLYWLWPRLNLGFNNPPFILIDWLFSKPASFYPWSTKHLHITIHTSFDKNVGPKALKS